MRTLQVGPLDAKEAALLVESDVGYSLTHVGDGEYFALLEAAEPAFMAALLNVGLIVSATEPDTPAQRAERLIFSAGGRPQALALALQWAGDNPETWRPVAEAITAMTPAHVLRCVKLPTTRNPQ